MADRDRFEAIIAAVLAQEGEHQAAHGDDPGGETWYGITRRDHPDEPWPPTRARAVEIYRADYWAAPRIYLLPPALALVVFDAAVNQGATTAVRMLQEELGVPADGIIGPVTLDAIRETNLGNLIGSYLAARAIRYSLLLTWPTWRRGWLRRLFAMHRTALTLMGA